MVASFSGPAHAQWHIKVHVEARRPWTALPLCEVEQTTQVLGQPTPLLPPLPLAARTVST